MECCHLNSDSGGFYFLKVKDEEDGVGLVVGDVFARLCGGIGACCAQRDALYDYCSEACCPNDANTTGKETRNAYGNTTTCFVTQDDRLLQQKGL